MKKFIYIVILLFILTPNVNGQTSNTPITYTTYLGTGLPMSQPSHTPFTWELMSHYHINQQFTIGAGTGLSFYEKLLIPLYASAQFFFIKSKKVTPYLECNIGGAFATDKETNGGFYLSPSVGIQFKATQKLKINLGLGYELQKLERLKKRSDEYFHTEFKEELSHHSIKLKVGLTY